MITGYAQSGRVPEGLRLFECLVEEKYKKKKKKRRCLMITLIDDLSLIFMPYFIQQIHNR